MNVLYISHIEDLTIKRGSSQIENRNRESIKRLQGREFEAIFDKYKISFLDNLFLRSTPTIISRISHKLDTQLYTHIFFSHPYFGRVAEYIKKKYPNIIIITFFHDVVYDLMLVKKRLLGMNRGLRGFLAIKSIKDIERKGCRYSDIVITLNSRDAKRIEELYNRSVDYIIPSSLDDMFDNLKATKSNGEDINYLFIGANFYANIEGLQWFISKVMPHIAGVLHIVGVDMNNVKFNDLDNDRVKISGYVEDLSHYYYNADIVISPILSGTGMKTKTAEAMMYGKRIVGTRESFEGYNIDDDNIYECNSAKEFIDTLNMLSSEDKISRFNQSVRDIYLKNYSQKQALELFREVFK